MQRNSRARKMFFERLNLAKYYTTLIFLGLAKPAIKAHSAILCVCLWMYATNREFCVHVPKSLSVHMNHERTQLNSREKKNKYNKLYHGECTRTESEWKTVLVTMIPMPVWECLYARVYIFSQKHRKSAFYWVVIFFHSHVYHLWKRRLFFFLSELFALAVIHTDAWIQNNAQSLSIANDSRIGRRSGEIGTNVNTIEESRIMLITWTELHSRRHIHTQRHPHSCMAVLYNRIDV